MMTTRAENSRLAQCEGKFPHASRADGERAIRRDRKGRLNVYRCHWCRFWHVGSSMIPKGERRGR